MDNRHPLLRTLFIPSAILHTHNLEIFVQASPAAYRSYGGSSAASPLVPELQTRTSTSGRLSTITFPVHKALIFQEGLKDLGNIPDINVREKAMYNIIIDWSWSTLQQQSQRAQSIAPINLALGEAAIDAIRQSLRRSVEYEHMWFDAGMSGISAWIVDGTE